MDELSQKLSEILSDPESMNRVREMAESLLSGPDEKKAPEINLLSGAMDGLGTEDMQRLIKIFSKLNSAERDSRAELLLALKPHLSDEKKKKVDSAIKILKIIELWPLIKDSGLINL